MERIIAAIVDRSPAAATDRPARHGEAALRVDFADAPAALRFTFADADAVATRVHCTHLAGPRASENWQLDARHRAVVIERTEVDGDIAAATAAAYAELIARVRGSSHPYLLRIWNYLDAINAGDGDGERYRCFCVGRAAAVDAAFNDPPPAATAIGHDLPAGLLQVVALCGKAPAIALENPRQTPAWNYPRQHGPVPPGFSRGAVLDAGSASPLLLASGTASIVGHVSRHVGDTGGQLRETVRNLDALLTAGSARTGHRFDLRDCRTLRVYLRHATDLALAQAVLAESALPPARIVYLRGDVCRRELDVEMEGVFAGDGAP